MGRLITSVPLWETATTINATAAVTSPAVAQKFSLGTCGIKIILAGSSPSVDVVFQVSLNEDPTQFTDALNTAKTTVAAIATTLTASAYITFSPAIAPYIRIKITGDGSNGANTTVRAYLIFQEETR